MRDWLLGCYLVSELWVLRWLWLVRLISVLTAALPGQLVVAFIDMAAGYPFRVMLAALMVCRTCRVRSRVLGCLLTLRMRNLLLFY